MSSTTRSKVASGHLPSAALSRTFSLDLVTKPVMLPALSQTVAEIALGEDSTACGLQPGTANIIQTLLYDVEQKKAVPPDTFKDLQ